MSVGPRLERANIESPQIQRATLTLTGCLSCRVRPFHTRKCLCYPLEQILDIVAKLSTSFHKHQIVLLGFILSLLRCDFSFFVQISLVANQHNDNVVSSLRSDIINPLLRVLKGLCV